MEREFYANIIKQNKKRVLRASVVKHQIFNLKKIHASQIHNDIICTKILMIQARPYHLMHYRLTLKDWAINDWIVVSCEMRQKKKKRFQKVPAIKCDKFSVKSFSRHIVKCDIVYWVRSFHFDELDKVPLTPSSV